MRDLAARFLSQSISRRTFLKGLTTAGISLSAAKDIVEALVPTAQAQAASRPSRLSASTSSRLNDTTSQACRLARASARIRVRTFSPGARSTVRLMNG